MQKYSMKLMSVLSVLTLMVGCETTPVVTPEPDPATLPINEPIKTDFLSWEREHSERAAWTKSLLASIRPLQDELDKAQDAKKLFCPNFDKMNSEQRLMMWGELIVAMAYHESGWKPTSRMVETTMSTDPVTKKQVASEGLLQLSYQDVPNYSGMIGKGWCAIDWSKDKGLADKDPKKTIFDPAINLDCGVKILANQVKRKGKVILTSGVYWAVIKEGGKYQKINDIIKRVQSEVAGCQ